MPNLDTYHQQRTVRCACAVHGDGLVESYEPTSDLDANVQLYQLEGWPFLLKRCDCPNSTEPLDIYTALTAEQARAWIEAHQ